MFIGELHYYAHEAFQTYHYVSMDEIAIALALLILLTERSCGDLESGCKKPFGNGGSPLNIRPENQALPTSCTANFASNSLALGKVGGGIF